MGPELLAELPDGGYPTAMSPPENRDKWVLAESSRRSRRLPMGRKSR